MTGKRAAGMWKHVSAVYAYAKNRRYQCYPIKGKNQDCWNGREHKEILEYIEKHRFLLMEERYIEFEY